MFFEILWVPEAPKSRITEPRDGAKSLGGLENICSATSLKLEVVGRLIGSLRTREEREVGVGGVTCQLGTAW